MAFIDIGSIAPISMTILSVPSYVENLTVKDFYPLPGNIFVSLGDFRSFDIPQIYPTSNENLTVKDFYPLPGNKMVMVEDLGISSEQDISMVYKNVIGFNAPKNAYIYWS